jgi:PAS domain S-box-containing protein
MISGQEAEILKKIVKHSLDIICAIDKDGRFLIVSEACKDILGYENEELTGRKFIDFVCPNDRVKAFHFIQGIISGFRKTSFESCHLHKEGEQLAILWSAFWSEEHEALFCIGRDVTESKLVNEKLREKDELYQALVECGADMFTLFDESLNYIKIGGSIYKELGYTPEQLIGDNPFNFIHPEDILLVQESLTEGLASTEQIRLPEFRFKDAKGKWRWLEAKGINLLHNPAVKALVVVSRDITEKVRSRKKLKESEKKFKSLFEHYADMVLFKNKKGVIVDANAAALSFFGIQKQDILNRPFSDFFPAEVIPVCKQTLQEALNGKSVRFEIDVPFKGKDVFTFDVVKMPVEVDGEIIGAYSILRDITEISRSNLTIRRQAERMNTILESITDAFFTLDNDWNFTYTNREFERLFRMGRKELLGKNFWNLPRGPLNEELNKQLKNVAEEGKTVHFDVYFDRMDKWLEVKAFPSEEGLSVFINDITEGVESKQELEKLSLVVNKTTNGVVIMNAVGVAEWVNEGFEKLTGYTSSEVKGKRPDYLLQARATDKASVKLIRENRKKAKSYTTEMMINKKSGDKVWLLIDVTPVLNEEGEITKFVSIQTDITERKEAEESQLQMTNDLFKQNKDLQQFTYIVSHNLRSPVASIMGLADLLTTTVEKDPETFNVSLRYLKRTADQLDTVLRDLNQILSIRNKKAATVNEKVELLPVCQQVIKTLEEPLNECGGKVFIKIEEGISVNGNKAYLYSIFYNLLSNSIKYRSPERSLEVNIKCYSNNDTGVVISFSDNGLGFDMDRVGDNIFKLYKRFHTNFEGKGIGLYLVKTQVEAMDGQIEVNSRVNVGTTFLIYLNKF